MNKYFVSYMIVDRGRTAFGRTSYEARFIRSIGDIELLEEHIALRHGMDALAVTVLNWRPFEVDGEVRG